MKFLKSFIRKIQSKATVNMNKRPLVMTLLILLSLNLIIMIVSAILATKIAPTSYDNFISGMIAAITWIFSANSINNLPEKTLPLYLLCGITIIVGIVLFTGTIIATTTNALKDFFAKKSSAKGKLILDDHFVILNWNSKVPDMLVDLMYQEKAPTVLILSDKDKEYINDEVRNALAKDTKEKPKKIDIIVRQGDPLNRSELADISLNTCRAIAIMSTDSSEAKEKPNLGGIDLNTLRLILAVGDNAREGCNVVVEVESHETVKTLDSIKNTIDSVKKLKLSIISFNRKLGQIMADAIAEPGLFQVLTDLFSFDGDEFYACEDMSIDEYLENYTNSIPAARMNKLYVLCENASDLKKKRKTKFVTERRLKLASNFETKRGEEKTLFIVGNNNRTPYMVENLKGTEQAASMNILSFGKDENAKLVETINKTEGQKEIIILSDDTISHEYFDSNVFATLIALNKEGIQEKANVIAEILDTRNIDCMKDFKVSNTIISNRLISLLINQLLTNEDSNEFYEAILSIDKDGARDIDIVINRASSMLDMNQDLTFSTRSELISSFYYSMSKKYMLLGIRRDGENTYFNTNMDKKEEITIKEDDQLIMIAYSD